MILSWCGTVKFVYSFALIDIKGRMYIGYSTSFKNEKESFERALALVRKNGIKVNSLRLDRYYSREAYVNICQEALGNVKMYMIPKKNIASLGVGEWCRMIYAFVEETKTFLREYF